MAEQEEQSGEKEFEATDERLKQAREDGDVPLSKEANTLGLLIGIGISAIVFVSFTSGQLSEGFSSLFYYAEEYATDIFTDHGVQTRGTLADIMLSILPIFAVLAACVLLVLILQRGIAFSTKKIQPDVKKLSPVENIKKKYGASAMGRDDLGSFTLNQILKLIFYFGVFQVALALLDLPLQHYLHGQRLRMTREDLKKEMKQNEGDPQLKQQRRERGTQITRSDMLKNVETATVVMVNPEHYAVALKWDPEGDSAPVCVAKGVDHLAAKIREVAQANGVPIYRDPPTTRSMYRLVEIDEEIKQEHFAAVAAAIQYVERVRQHMGQRNE